MTRSPKFTRNALIAAIAAVALVGVGASAGFWLASSQPSPESGQDNVLYWYDPMYPDQHFDAPGKSPFMNMELIPRRRGERVETQGVVIDPSTRQNLGVRLASVERAMLAPAIRASGVIGYNDRDVAVVEAKSGGFVVRGYRRATGDLVVAGEPLIDLRAPAWTAALADYLVLKGDPQLMSSARQRLDLLGVPSSAISSAEDNGAAPTVFTLRAPIGGAITRLDAREGMNIAPGSPIATINGTSPVWVIASIPQGAAAPVREGMIATVRLPALAGEALTGKVEAVLPAVSSSSRAVEVRVALQNPAGRIRPGMTADVLLAPAGREALLIPSEAIIRTGARTLVIVAEETGGFLPVAVEIGASDGDRTEAISGLAAGQRVVASGQFLIDSEASLSGVVARLEAGASVSSPGLHSSKGRITAVSSAGLMISHDPVASLNWPSMTMEFSWGAGGSIAGLKIGDEVDFTFRESGMGYQLETVAKARQTP